MSMFYSLNMFQDQQAFFGAPTGQSTPLPLRPAAIIL